MFRHGGMIGRFKDTDLLPHFAKLLILLQYESDARFTSLVLGVTPQLPHVDSQNDPFSSNVVLPPKDALQALVPCWLDPRRRHGVTEWHGDRAWSRYFRTRSMV